MISLRSVKCAYNALVDRVVLQSLREDVDLWSQAYHKAKENFWHISSEFAQNDRLRIEEAARAQTQAMIAYTQALKRLNQFLLEGRVPEDLRGSGDKKGRKASA